MLYCLKAENKATNDAILNMITLVGGVVVAIGMVGLVNSITMNVIERTREIGVLRCVGARAFIQNSVGTRFEFVGPA